MGVGAPVAALGAAVDAPGRAVRMEKISEDAKVVQLELAGIAGVYGGAPSA